MKLSRDVYVANTCELQCLGCELAPYVVYPKANTPGCTAQACNLSENYSVLSDAGFSIIGVSADKVKAQSSFSSKFGGFPYPLLADTEKKIINAFYYCITRIKFLL